MKYLLALDQGTSSTRAMLFDAALKPIATAQQELPQIYPSPGWVEHEPEAIWQASLATLRDVLKKANLTAADIAALGITNQRETTLLWDRTTGKTLHNAIVWQDRRTADACAKLREQGAEPTIRAKTGLLLDPYFSATKLAWLLENIPHARTRAEKGELAFGTVDSFLLWRLTGGKIHATDATNAARTSLFNIHTGMWDAELLKLFNIPAALLPQVKDCAANFGTLDPSLLGATIPIGGIAGDQQAATIGQCCFQPGMLKATYGTGCFALLNTGSQAITSTNRLLTTIAYQLDGTRTYALEGAIFVAGAAVQWLRDGLHLIKEAKDADALAAQADPNSEAILVPAFTGLGAPWWDAAARGALFNLTRQTGAAELTKAALESVAYQTHDLLTAMQADWPELKAPQLRVDGGMTASNVTLQSLADLLNLEIARPAVLETTALGAAWLAARTAGLPLSAAPPATTQTFQPTLTPETRTQKLTRWHTALNRTRSRSDS